MYYIIDNKISSSGQKIEFKENQTYDILSYEDHFDKSLDMNTPYAFRFYSCNDTFTSLNRLRTQLKEMNEKAYRITLPEGTNVVMIDECNHNENKSSHKCNNRSYKTNMIKICELI